MKKIFLFLLVAIPSLHGKSQETKDSVSRHREPKFISSTLFQMQVFAPGTANLYDMSYKFSGGTWVIYSPFKKVVITGGLRLWQNAGGTYSLSSRSWLQGGFHGAISVLYKHRFKKSYLIVGPAVAKFSYIMNAIPEWYDNTQFHKVRKLATDSVPGIRGNYYSALYLFAIWQKRTRKETIDLEVNLAIPGKFPRQITSWQPRGSLIHAIRLKGLYETKKLSFLVDAQLPSFVKEERKMTYNISPVNATGRIEIGYNMINMAAGKIKISGGYERDWHAYNFPGVIKQNATWGALYTAIKIDLSGGIK